MSENYFHRYNGIVVKVKLKAELEPLIARITGNGAFQTVRATLDTPLGPYHLNVYGSIPEAGGDRAYIPRTVHHEEIEWIRPVSDL